MISQVRISEQFIPTILYINENPMSKSKPDNVIDIAPSVYSDVAIELFNIIISDETILSGVGTKMSTYINVGILVLAGKYENESEIVIVDEVIFFEI